MRQDTGYEFKQRMMRGDKVFGPLIGPGNDPVPTVAALKDMGYDFFMIDNEHSLVGKDAIYVYIRLAREYEMPILMRPEKCSAPLSPYLDSGVQGLMLPQVDDVEQALRAVDEAYFPPLGNRGSGIGMSPYLLDGMDVATTPLLTMTEYVNRNTMLFPQSESLMAIKNLPRTLQLEGIDGTIVGTHDLALNIGDIAPGMTRAEVDRLVDAIIYATTQEELTIACQALDRVLWYGYFVVPNWYLASWRLAYTSRFRQPATLPLYYSPDQLLMTWWDGTAQ